MNDLIYEAIWNQAMHICDIYTIALIESGGFLLCNDLDYDRHGEPVGRI